MAIFQQIDLKWRYFCINDSISFIETGQKSKYFSQDQNTSIYREFVIKLSIQDGDFSKNLFKIAIFPY